MTLLPLRLLLNNPVVKIVGDGPRLPCLIRWPGGSLRSVTGVALLALLASCQSARPPQPDTLATGAETSSYRPTGRLPISRSASGRATQTADDSALPVSTPWIDSIRPLFLHARTLVENELGVDLRDIELLLVDDSPINEEVSRETRRLVNQQFGTSEFADQFLSRVMKTQSGTYAALFTSRLQAVMVSRSMLSNYERSLPEDPEVRAAALMTLLVHELVHAADDKRYDIHENRALNFRASFAQSATFEGHAQWVTRRICAVHGCTEGLHALDNFMFSRYEQSNQLTQPVEAISRNVLEYSYIEGERFIASLATRVDGALLIDQLLRNPPFDPIQILAPENYPDVDRERRNQRLIRASLDVDHPWVRGHWIGVETSPLKGVNLRGDPSRRQAAVDGFTRLIHGMVSMQLYDRSRPDANPMEVTLLQAESASTAKLFASTLHQNTQLVDARIEAEPLRIKTGAGNQQSLMDLHLYRTALDGDLPFLTAIAVSGTYVVQVAGTVSSADSLDDYAIRVLLNLQLPQ